MIALLDCFSGISGDMLLGALVDAGAPADDLRAGLAALPLAGWHLEVAHVADHGLAGTRARVVVDETTAVQPHRHLAEIEALVGAAALPDRARARALAVFRRLAAAEAEVHATTVAKVEFHEVGAVDAIIDVAGTTLALELLGVDQICCPSVPLATGSLVTTSHGRLPIPAPATLALLTGSGISLRPPPGATTAELVTPTGAAVLAALAQPDVPTLVPRAVGYGFGQRRLPWPNGLRVVLGESVAVSAAAAGLEWDEIVVLEANIDNMTGEALGWLMERLLAAGALDVSFEPIQMKKNRPATRLSLLATPQDVARLAEMVLRESATLGVRMHRAERFKAGRRVEEIETPLGPVRVKLKLIGDQVVSIAPEYDDCRALAERLGLPLESVSTRVAAAARHRYGLDP
jgi:uncharacterized protein (TIGR00299 family) protein